MPVAALITALLLTPPGTPAGGFRWQRIITPPPGAATQQACVVLDAATFANAAPALRDLRLFQDGTELPYVIEESYDERALNSGVTPDDDRSEYEPVADGELGLSPTLGVASGRMPPDPRGYGGWLRLQARVPVERLRLDRVLPHATAISVEAGDVPETTEAVHLTLAKDSAVAPITLGANLQQPVSVAIAVVENDVPLHHVILEMRRRSLCYQPRSAAPLTLYLGGGEGIAAKTYGLSNGFSVSANRPYATMGPLEPNPDLDRPAHHPISRLLIAIAILGAALLLTLWIGLELLRKDPHKQTSRPTAAQ